MDNNIGCMCNDDEVKVGEKECPEHGFQPPARKKRGPLEAGHPRRLTDAKCAWRHMTDAQRLAFVEWCEKFQTGEAT